MFVAFILLALKNGRHLKNLNAWDLECMRSKMHERWYFSTQCIAKLFDLGCSQERETADKGNRTFVLEGFNRFETVSE